MTTMIDTISGTIELVSGLHIGGSGDTIEIGGMDNPVIKNPLNSEPYIPGSSLKGKIRCLLEWKLGKTKICECGDCQICRLFGCAESRKVKGPTRLLFHDCSLTKNWSQRFHSGELPLEAKYEVTIDREKGKVGGGGPRQTERVPAGVSFVFELSYRRFDTADWEEDFTMIREGLRLLQMDALGGSGSRGYGRIRFENLALNGESFELFDK